jgi:hypothetical protein
MDKDITVCDKKQTKSPKNIIEYGIFNKDKNYILNLLSFEYGLSFEGGKCVQTDSIAIHKNGASWFVKKFNETKYPNLPPYANFEGIIFALTSHLQGNAKLNAQLAIIARCGAAALPTPNNLPEKQPKPRQSQKRGLNVEFCELKKDALDYFAAKGGITKGTLDRYGTKSAHKINGYTQYYPSFGWVVGDNTKIKRPKHKEKKYLQTKGKQPYIFGFSQLPKQGETLLICAGETDTLCINEHCNGHGVWAICLSSENDLTTLNDSLINELKTRFKQIFIVYDADETGYKYGRELALKTGFVWVNTLLYSSWGNDICEFWANKYDLKHFINHFSNNLKHRRLNAVSCDNFSIDVPFVYELEFNQYINENSTLDAIKDILCVEKHLAIQSPAGTGKSTMILELCKAYNGTNFVKERLKLPKTIVTAPTVAIAEQLQIEFEKQGVSVSLIFEGTKGENLKVARYDTLVITTFDGIAKLTEFIPNSFLIVDEFHQIGNDFGYRKKAMRMVFNSIQNAPRVLLLSATPTHIFCSHIAPFFDYSLVLGVPKTTNKINLTFLEHTAPKAHLIDYINENSTRSKGTICVKYDNNKALETYFKEDRNSFAVEHFTSSDKYGRERRENNENYKAIMNTGAPIAPLQRLYFTTLLEAGVSLKFAVGLVGILDVKSWSKIIQLATRPRLHKDGNGRWVNSELDVWVFVNKPKAIEPQTKTITELWKHFFDGATVNAGALNGVSGGDIEHKTTTDFVNYCQMDFNGVWLVDIPAILNELFNRETSQTDVATLTERIKRFDPRFCIDFKQIQGTENAELSQLLAATKAEKEHAQSALFELLESNTAGTISALCKLTKDRALKELAKRVLPLTQDKEAVNELIRLNPSAFAQSDKNRLLRDLIFLVGSKGETLKNAVQCVVNMSKKELTLERDTHQRKERIKTYKKEPENQSPKDRLEVERERAICRKIAKVLDNIKQGKRKNQFTANELAKIVNGALVGVTFEGKTVATPKKISTKAVVSYLSQFYEIEQKRVGEKLGRIYFYSILKVKKLG